MDNQTSLIKILNSANCCYVVWWLLR